MIGPTVGMVILVNRGNPPYPSDDSALTIRADFYPPINLRAGGALWRGVVGGPPVATAAE